MTTVFDDHPDVSVQVGEYTRLLGFPRGWELRDRSLELADWARDWYARHGRPWVYARETQTLDAAGDEIRIDGVTFTSPRLAKTVRGASAHSAMIVAASAGPELETEAQRLWQDSRPDEYFFLEVYGSAVVEHLITMTGAGLCASYERRQMAVLPHYSPGYPEWSIEEQGPLFALMRPGHPLALEVLQSGMLRPKKSILAVFGITRHIDRVRPLTDLVPCENCSFNPCQYRRVAFKRATEHANAELSAVRETRPPAAAAPQYTVNEKALQRWTRDRLSLTQEAGGHVEAVFRYDGTTCMNMGRPMTFRYEVTLGPRERGYPILRQHCGPATGDDGHTFMCRYISQPAELMSAILTETPLAGQPLGEVLAWSRPECAAGCYCDADARQHKWGLVLETIHYALSRSPIDATRHKETS